MKLILVIQLITGRRPHLYSKIKVQLLLSRLLHWLLTEEEVKPFVRLQERGIKVKFNILNK